MLFCCDRGLKLASELQERESLWLKKAVKAIAEKEIFLLRLQQKPRLKICQKNGAGGGGFG